MIVSFYHFFSGGVMMAALTIGVLFWRFYLRTNDRFFALFSAAFFLLGVNRVAIIVFTTQEEKTAIVFFMIRFVAYLLIIVAIIDKNRTRKTHPHFAQDPSRQMRD